MHDLILCYLIFVNCSLFLFFFFISMTSYDFRSILPHVPFIRVHVFRFILWTPSTAPPDQVIKANYYQVCPALFKPFEPFGEHALCWIQVFYAHPSSDRNIWDRTCFVCPSVCPPVSPAISFCRIALNLVRVFLSGNQFQVIHNLGSFSGFLWLRMDVCACACGGAVLVSSISSLRFVVVAAVVAVNLFNPFTRIPAVCPF